MRENRSEGEMSHKLLKYVTTLLKLPLYYFGGGTKILVF